MAPQPSRGLMHTVRTDYPPLHAFEFGAGNDPRRPLALFVGGLGDTLLSTPYLSKLATALEAHGWRLAQARPTSAGMGWGGRSVEQDAREIALCTEYFKQQGADKIVLMGCSTGCQDAIAYHHASSDFVPPAGVVLQAPVSDREIKQVQELLKKHADEGIDYSKPDQQSFCPQAWSKFWHCTSGLTYARWRSLVEKPASDTIDLAVSEDFFSSDLSDARLRNVFAPVKCPLMIALGTEDASYPPHVKADLPALLERFKEAAPTLTSSMIIDGATHTLGDGKHADEFVDEVVKFVGEL
ncbi:hypothetical protein JCM9279_006281 [Rhodotorula babjevae]